MKFKYNGQWVDLAIKALDSMAIGTGIEFYGSSIPTGWLICDGSAISRTEYNELFDVIGTTYGAGDGSTTFNIPNKKGRVGVGLDLTQTEFDTLGEIGGVKEVTLTVSQIPSHSHSTYLGTVDDQNFTSNPGQYPPADGPDHVSATVTSNNSGGDEAHTNLQPYIVVNYLIKAKNTVATFSSVVDDFSTSTTDAYSCAYINNLFNSNINGNEVEY